MATIKSSTIDGVFVVSIEGYLSMGSNFRQIVTDAITGGSKKIVIDFSRSAGIDSASLGDLVVAYTKTINAGGKFVVVTIPNTKVMAAFQITSIVRIFKIYGSVADAIQALKETTPAQDQAKK